MSKKVLDFLNFYGTSLFGGILTLSFIFKAYDINNAMIFPVSLSQHVVVYIFWTSVSVHRKRRNKLLVNRVPMIVVSGYDFCLQHGYFWHVPRSQGRDDKILQFELKWMFWIVSWICFKWGGGWLLSYLSASPSYFTSQCIESMEILP